MFKKRNLTNKLKKNRLQEKDFLIPNLPETIKNLMTTANLPWFNSLSFNTLYGENPAQKVWLKMDSKKIYQAAFYLVDRKMGFLKTIEIKGFPNISDAQIRALMQANHAQLGLVNRLEPAVQPNENWQAEQAHIYLHNYVSITVLPSSKEDYLKSLGKNKQQQLPKYWRRLNRHFNDGLEVRCETKKAINLEDVIEVECLNRNRRSEKGKGVESTSEIRQRQEQQWPITQEAGLLVTIRHQGKILSGGLAYIYGDEAFYIALGHDTEYDQFHLGTLVVWKTIESLIDRGVSRFNFLWGRQAYKKQFGAIEYPWTKHFISPYPLLAVLWKYQMQSDLYFNRLSTFVKTRLGLNQ